MIPARDSLLDQLHSVITGDDLVPIVIDTDTVAGALKRLKQENLMEDLLCLIMFYVPLHF